MIELGVFYFPGPYLAIDKVSHALHKEELCLPSLINQIRFSKVEFHMVKKNLIFYGWFIVAAGVIVYAVGYGSRYSFSVIFPSLLEEFHWPRDKTAAMLSFHILVYGFFAPISGYLSDKIGPRLTMTLGTLLLSLGLALSGIGTVPWHFYLSFGILTGVGLCLIGAVPFTSVMRNWFDKKRGLAFSILFFGAGLAFACYPGIAFLIQHLGWRYTFLVEAFIVAALVLPLVIIIVRYHPHEKGLMVDGLLEESQLSTANPNKATESTVTDTSWAAVDWTLLRAVKTVRFWLLCLSTFSLWGVMEHIMVTHHIAFAVDAGYTKMYASSVLSLFGFMFAFGSLAALVSDRIGREMTFTIGIVFIVSGISVLAFIRDTSHPWMLYYYAVTVGFGLGMTTPTIPASITDIFQGPKVGTVIGFIWFCFAMGGAIGPWLGGRLFEITKSYMIAFLVAITLSIVSCAAIWLAAPRKLRPVSRVTHSTRTASP